MDWKEKSRSIKYILNKGGSMNSKMPTINHLIEKAIHARESISLEYIKSKEPKNPNKVLPSHGMTRELSLKELGVKYYSCRAGAGRMDKQYYGRLDL